MVRFTKTLPRVAVAAMLLSACSDVATSPSTASSPLFSKGGGSGGGSGGGNSGGGGTTTPPPAPLPSPLPTTAPAPGVLLRESFGMAANQRPQGGKGDMRDAFVHTTLNGFWLEYLGSKDTQWLTPTSGQTWKFAGCSDDPYEMPSPLQATSGNGCVASEWFDPVTSYPTALQPFAAPSSDYELSMDGYPAPIPNGYVAIGFTNSGVVTSNLTSVGALWLRVRNENSTFGPLHYELRTGGMTGPVLASGDAGFPGWNRMSLRYSPANSTVTLSVDGTTIGTYPFSMPAPRYVAFEGVGILDNFVVRQ